MSLHLFSWCALGKTPNQLTSAIGITLGGNGLATLFSCTSFAIDLSMTSA